MRLWICVAMYCLVFGMDICSVLINHKVACHLSQNAHWKAPWLTHLWFPLKKKINHMIHFIVVPVDPSPFLGCSLMHEMCCLDARKDDKGQEAKEEIVQIIIVMRVEVWGHWGDVKFSDCTYPSYEVYAQIQSRPSVNIPASQLPAETVTS